MAKRTRAAMIATAVGTLAVGSMAFTGHSTRPTPIVVASASRSVLRTTDATDAASRHASIQASARGGRVHGQQQPAPKAIPTKTVQVHSHYTEPPGNVDGAQCRGLVAVKPDCQGRYVGTSTYTGTMWGDETYDLTFWATPDGKLTYSGYAFFTGGIEGCGTGTYSLDAEGYTDMARFDPVTHGAPGYVTWRLRPGGTGQLTNLVSGQGEIHWTDYFLEHNRDVNKSGEGDVTGTITCRI